MTIQPIFFEPWWLDAVAGPDGWGECRVEQGSQLLARLVFGIREISGRRYLVQPALTQTLGPWFAPFAANTKYAQSLAREKDLTDALLAQLPPHDEFKLRFSTDIHNWLPWYWHKYQQSTRYTYRLPDLTDLERVWSAMETRVRGDIRKAEKSGIVITTSSDIQQLYEMQKLSFKRQGMANPYSLALLQRVDTACRERNACRLLLAKDQQNRVHAAVYLVWTEYATYYLMGGGHPQLRGSGAASLALWEAIRFASQVSRQFDFEGSMREPIERYFRGFGARQIPYFEISRVPNKWLAVKQHLKAIAGLVRSGDV